MLPQPDLRPLQQPRSREADGHARRWLRAHRQPADAPAVGLAVAGWVLLLPGALLVLAALPGDADPAMPVVGGVLAGIGAALLAWRAGRRRDALRRTARLLPFAEANGLGYAQRALLGPKPAAALREGFDWVARDVLRAPDGAEWGVWRYRLLARSGHEELRGYVELPWAAAAPAPGFVAALRDAPMPLDVEVAGGTLTVTARSGWRMDDPAVQALVHRIRTLAATRDGERAAVASVPMPPIASTAAGRRQAASALLIGAGVAVAAVALAVGQALVRAAA
ncbi:hypothetical protein EDD26_1915 [Agrococcus jenensis]|uniref:Uncharacterized protein n=2 Tax=Agrococcus jenensis TaxID=46353 RepID=A0A3N2AU19_9MICO|nr:hypothetical protein EDD26_1915 [Agrococcus jenensis]